MGAPTTRGALMKFIKNILRYICTGKQKKVEFTKKYICSIASHFHVEKMKKLKQESIFNIYPIQI